MTLKNILLENTSLCSDIVDIILQYKILFDNKKDIDRLMISSNCRCYPTTFISFNEFIHYFKYYNDNKTFYYNLCLIYQNNSNINDIFKNKLYNYNKLLKISSLLNDIYIYEIKISKNKITLDLCDYNNDCLYQKKLVTKIKNFFFLM